MLIVLPCLLIENHRLVPVTFVKRRYVSWRYYEKGGVKNRCGKGLSELRRNRGIVGQGGIKTGHKAVESQT